MASNRRFSATRALILLAILAIGAPFFLSACTKKKISGGSKILLPWPTGAGQYELAVVELSTLREATSLTGDAAKILVEPRVLSDGLHGEKPSARFVETNEGVLVPTDFMSAQFAGVYAHAEKLWDFDRAAGVDGVLPRPRQFGVKIRTSQDLGGRTNNALYSADHDAVVLMPYDGDGNDDYKKLPLALNAGVLAHEHFHALFNAIVGPGIIMGNKNILRGLGCNIAGVGLTISLRHLDPNLTETDLRNLITINSFNEGLADFWGWLYSGDDDFIVHSLPQFKDSRTLKISNANEVAFSTNEFNGKISNMAPHNVEEADTLSYEQGSRIARQLKVHALKSLGMESQAAMSASERLQIAGIVMKMLPNLAQSINASFSDKTIILSDLPVQTFDKLVVKSK